MGTYDQPTANYAAATQFKQKNAVVTRLVEGDAGARNVTDGHVTIVGHAESRSKLDRPLNVEDGDVALVGHAKTCRELTWPTNKLAAHASIPPAESPTEIFFKKVSLAETFNKVSSTEQLSNAVNLIVVSKMVHSNPIETRASLVVENHRQFGTTSDSCGVAGSREPPKSGTHIKVEPKISFVTCEVNKDNPIDVE